MRKYFLLGSIVILVVMGSAGCSTSGEYRCESNDLCSTTTDWKYYSCSNDTGHCEKVDPLAIDPLILPDATIGQSDYQVEVIGSGGIQPYLFALTRGDEDKLKWLTLTPEGENKAILHNSTGTNNEPLVPTDMNGGVPLTLTIKLLDSSKHGIDVREDNQGKAFQMAITIKDCERPCAVDGPTKCESGILSHCEAYFGSCTRWVETEGQCTSKRCNKNGVDCCVGAIDRDLCGDLTQARCKDGWIQKCDEDSTTGCLFYTNDQQCADGCNTDGSSCKNCTNECSNSGDRKCSDDNKSIYVCELNISIGGCLVWTPYEQCQDDPASHCLSTGCTNGQCTYRYTIQMHNGVEEVYDAATNLSWKRQIEPNNTSPGLYTWSVANSQCFSPYHLPSIYHSYANPSIAELDTLLETGHGAPYLDTCAFHNMPSCSVSPRCTFWSSSGYVGNADVAWYMDFKNGYVSNTGISNTINVRCVRSGP